MSIRPRDLTSRARRSDTRLATSHIAWLNRPSGFLVRAVLGVLLAAFSLSPAKLGSQVVRGLLVDGITGDPLEGAMVHLLSPGDQAIAQVLTDAGGRFSLSARASGRYRIRADRIGHASTFSPEFRVVAGDTLEYRLEAEVEPVRLAEVVVEGSGRCEVRPDQGVATARVWEEARKALAAAAWTEERGIYRFQVMKYVRDLDPSASIVRSEEQSVRQSYQKSPWVSLPADKLIHEGFMEPDRDGYLFYGPDANVLLSDLFLDTHCMRLEEGAGEAEGLLGLAFEPTPGRRVVEIQGVLWLDPESAQLRWLEYRYRNLGLGISTQRIGGRVDFSALPNGTWIVRDWWIRMPHLGERIVRGTGERTVFLTGIREEGGRVMQVTGPRSEVILEADAATLSGVILAAFDRNPVKGANIRIEGTGRTFTTGVDGLFRFSGLTGGTYRVQYSLPFLEDLAYEPEPVEVVVVPGEVAHVRLSVPSDHDLLNAVCEGEQRPEGTAVVAGVVRRADTGEPIADATVRVLWDRWEVELAPTRRRPGRASGSGLRALVSGDREGVELDSDPRGRFIVCAVPVDHPLVGEVEHPTGVGHQTFRIPFDRRLYRIDLVIGP
jgi:hypothetical protein